MMPADMFYPPSDPINFTNQYNIYNPVIGGPLTSANLAGPMSPQIQQPIQDRLQYNPHLMNLHQMNFFQSQQFNPGLFFS
jgi:hypothetical protein